MPINRFAEMLDLDSKQVATESLGRPTATWLNTGIGQILINAHLKVDKEATHIGADETKMPVLGKTSPGAAQLLVCSSAPNANERFVVFDYMPSRSAEAIAQGLLGWKFQTINRDGYPGYASAFKKLGIEEHVRSQVCLVHARRAILRGLTDR